MENHYNILVTGSNGQLGNEIKKQASSLNDAAFFYTDVDTLDITNVIATDAFLKQHGITHIINCAAYTAVDKAETEKEASMLINGKAPTLLAQAARNNQSFLIHISTDYVFDGKGTRPYVETDQPNPMSVYGKSKWQGEQGIKQYANQAIIIRTAWLYAALGNNFVKTMQRLGKEKSEIGVVADQIGTPTHAADLAKAILQIIPQLSGWDKGVEIYHYSNEGVCSWYDFAKKIMSLSRLSCQVQAITTKDYPTPAYRPQYSVLDKSKIKKTFKLQIPSWEEALEAYIQENNEYK